MCFCYTRRRFIERTACIDENGKCLRCLKNALEVYLSRHTIDEGEFNVDHLNKGTCVSSEAQW